MILVCSFNRFYVYGKGFLEFLVYSGNDWIFIILGYLIIRWGCFGRFMILGEVVFSWGRF